MGRAATARSSVSAAPDGADDAQSGHAAGGGDALQAAFTPDFVHEPHSHPPLICFPLQ